jgi:hypothetical protein
MRILERHFHRMPQPGSTHSLPSGNELRVARDGSWFELPSGRRVHLGGRTALRLILSLLVDRTTSRSHNVIASREIIDMVWPSEHLSKGDGRNRLHVALNTLRKMGLHDVLQRSSEGYWLRGPVIVLPP